jgi:hypothetical protein
MVACCYNKSEDSANSLAAKLRVQGKKIFIAKMNILEANQLKRPLISAFVKSGRYADLEKYVSDFA